MEEIIKVSIVIPVFNVARYLDECVNSAVQQTYANLEIILVDDGSTDGSGEMCDEWGKRDNRVRVIHKPNGGLSDARNMALDIATGEYLIFLDGDDFIHPLLIEKCLTEIMCRNCDLIAFRMKRINEKERYEDYSNDTLIEAGVIGPFWGKDILKQHIENGLFGVSACNKMFFRDKIKTIRFPIGHVNEDNYTIPEILWKLDSAIAIDLELYYYRNREGSISNKKNEVFQRDMVLANEHMLEITFNDKEFYYHYMVMYLAELIKLYGIVDKEDKCVVRRQYKKTAGYSFEYMKASWVILFVTFGMAPWLYYVMSHIRTLIVKLNCFKYLFSRKD